MTTVSRTVADGVSATAVDPLVSPPPWKDAALSVISESRTVRVPELKMPPPLCAAFASMTLLRMVEVTWAVA